MCIEKSSASYVVFTNVFSIVRLEQITLFTSQCRKYKFVFSYTWIKGCWFWIVKWHCYTVLEHCVLNISKNVCDQYWKNLNPITFYWFFLILLSRFKQCWDCTSIRPRLLYSKYCIFHHAPLITILVVPLNNYK